MNRPNDWKAHTDRRKHTSSRIKGAELAGAGGRIRRGEAEQDSDRLLWENHDWAVTPAGLQSKWIRQWLIPKGQLLKFRDLAAVNLPRGVLRHTVPFAAALQAALSIHYTDEQTIDEIADEQSPKDTKGGQRA
jgi:hypothetical protein